MGPIDPEQAPVSMALRDSWRGQKKLNSQGQEYFFALDGHQDEVLTALARIEEAVNRFAGEVITDK